MVAEVARRPALLFGSARPRLCPPQPMRTLSDEYRQLAADIGIDLFPWQDTAGSYLYAVAPDGNWLYPEVAEVVSRQNGKSEQLVPHITKRLLMGRRIMHTAQNRELPREVFGRVADVFEQHFAMLLRKRPRFANGQEEIRLTNGGHYRIVAPTRGGARGHPNDDLIVDEVREFDSHDFIAAAGPTLQASANPQTLYLSNAGDESSAVLNAIRKRADEDPALAYLEWSAAPERSADDVAGWTEANPSIGHMPQMIANLERQYRTHRLGGTLAIFETEHLCRWVTTIRERVVDEYAWSLCEVAELPVPKRAYLGVSMDPSGTRASAVLAWRLVDETIAVRQILEATGSPIDTDALGKDLRDLANEHHALAVGYDPLTDATLAPYFRKAEKITGAAFANASARFALAVNSRKLRHNSVESVTDDLNWTAMKSHDESGSFQAVRADDDRPITAALAAIRAVWLASEPPRGTPRVY